MPFGKFVESDFVYGVRKRPDRTGPNSCPTRTPRRSLPRYQQTRNTDCIGAGRA